MKREEKIDKDIDMMEDQSTKILVRYLHKIVVVVGIAYSVAISKMSIHLSAILHNTAPITSRNWVQISGPNTATISGSTTTTGTFSNLVEGTYVFRFAVMQDDSQGVSADITVNVLPERSGGGNVFRIPVKVINQ